MEDKFESRLTALDAKFGALDAKLNYLLGLIAGLAGLVALFKLWVEEVRVLIAA